MPLTMRSMITEVLEKVLGGGSVDYGEAESLSRASGADLPELFAAANRVRERFRGNRVDVCSIVNAKSGACSEDCSFCAQSAHHATGASVYPLIPVERMKEAAAGAKGHGAKRFCIVTSGRGIDSESDLRNIAQAIEGVRSLGLSPCATLGTLTKEQLACLRDAGLHRYHHNIETSREYFPVSAPPIPSMNGLRSLALRAPSGCPRAAAESSGWERPWLIASGWLFALRDINVDSVPVNFLMPIMGTPFEDLQAITPLEALHAIALFRIILPGTEIRVCAGRGTALGRLHPLIFFAGADGFMIGNYLTTTGLDPDDDLKMIADLGLTV